MGVPRGRCFSGQDNGQRPSRSLAQTPARLAQAGPRPVLPVPRLVARRTGPPPARPPPARPAHSPADSLVGQLLHAVELLLHGGGATAARGSGRGELGTVWRFLHRFPTREAATEPTVRPRPRRVTSSSAARPFCSTDRVEPSRAERGRN